MNNVGGRLATIIVNCWKKQQHKEEDQKKQAEEEQRRKAAAEEEQRRVAQEQRKRAANKKRRTTRERNKRAAEERKRQAEEERQRRAQRRKPRSSRESQALKVLGLTRDVLRLAYQEKLAVIKHAFRELALKFHPDKGGTCAQFREITEAYEYLCSKVG